MIGPTSNLFFSVGISSSSTPTVPSLIHFSVQ
jgi:hypothetical protein